MIFLDPRGGPRSTGSVRVHSSAGGEFVFIKEMRAFHAIVQIYVFKKSIYLSFCVKTFVLHRKTWATDSHCRYCAFKQAHSFGNHLAYAPFGACSMFPSLPPSTMIRRASLGKPLDKPASKTPVFVRAAPQLLVNLPA